MKNVFFSKTVRALGIWLLVNSIACAGTPVFSSAAPKYSMGFYNSTSETITDIVVDWGPAAGRHMEDKGAMSSHSIATIGSQPRPIPKAFAVTWRSGDGKVHNQHVERKKIEPDEEQFSGVIWFKFGEDKVLLITKTFDELEHTGAGGPGFLD